MAFDNDAPSGGNAAPPSPNTTADAPAEATTNMPTGDTLQPPTAPPASQPPLQLKPAQSAPSRTFFRAVAHALSGAVLGTLAGPAPSDYSTNADGTQVATPRKDTNITRLQRVAQAALTGLAAGAEAPRRPGANALAGLSAGFQAQQAKMQQQDLLARQQDRENFEQQQKLLTDKAIRAGHNAATFRLHQQAQQEANDHDPERALNLSVKAGAEDFIKNNPGTSMKGSILSIDQAHAMLKDDAHTIADVVFYPLGMRDVRDPDGNPIYESDGVTTKQEGYVYAISGGRESGRQAGGMMLPQAVLDKARYFEPFIPGLNTAGLKAGQQMPLDRFFALNKLVTEAESMKMNGWKEAKAGENAVTVKDKDGKSVRMQRNTFDNSMRPYPGTPIETEKTQSEIDKNRGEAAKANTEANQQKQLNPAGAEGLTGEAYLQTLPQGQRDVIKAVAEGRETRSPRQLQDKNGNPTPFAVALHRAYPDFDDKNAKEYGNLVKDFKTGPTSRTLTSYGTAINHARALYDNTGPKSYIPGTDEYKRYNQDITYVATEVAKALNPTGVATESAIKEQEDALRSLTNRKAAIENAEHILSGKMSEVKQRWANGQVRPSYQPPMPGLSKEALDNAEYIRNQGKYLVTDPNGKSHEFPYQASADKFKKLAGIE